MNYGEEIAYWYFRLNVFFLIQNFVLHRYDAFHGPAQIDLLAIRPPFVLERIGAEDLEMDARLFAPMGGLDQWLGVICEVKTGRKVNDPFDSARLAGIVARLGLLTADDQERLIPQLSDAPHASVGTVTIAKVLISLVEAHSPRFHTVALDDAERFIQQRANRFAAVKHQDRMLFPWGLFQYAINHARHGRKG